MKKYNSLEQSSKIQFCATSNLRDSESSTVTYSIISSSLPNSSLKSGVNTDQFKCNKCHETFSHEDEMKLHIEYYHTKQTQNCQ